MDVDGVGEVQAVVDSGAAKSAVRYDIVAGTGLVIRPTRRKWMCADGFANGVIGEVELTVAYEGRLVRLPEVVVFKHLVEPFLLGIEWIDAANVAVMAESHLGVVVLRDDTMAERSETKEALETSALTDTDEEVEMPAEPATGMQDFAVVLQRKAFCSTLPEIEEETEEEVSERIDRPPQLSEPSVETHLPASSDPPEVSYMLQSNGCQKILRPRDGLHSQEPPVEQSQRKSETLPACEALQENEVLPSNEVTMSFGDWHEQRLEFHARSDPNYAPDVNPLSREFWKFKEGVDELQKIGTIVAASSESRPRAQPREKLHPLKCQRIPGWSKGFVTFRTPEKRNGSWMVSPSSGIEGGRGWATPACLVTAVDGLVQIPVTNADNRGWRDRPRLERSSPNG